MSSGRNNGRMMEAMNRIVTSGTPRTISMYKMQKPFTTGSELWRPKASATPMGNDATMPMMAKRTVKSNPPHSPVSTVGRKLVPGIP